MNVVAVDLAAKFSAACWMDDYTVKREWDSWQKQQTEFLDLICDPFDPPPFRPQPDYLIVEDLPHGIGYRTLVKEVCRLQGRIIDRLDHLHAADKIMFVQPQIWREHYGQSLKRGTGPEPVIEVATDFGYTPPPLDWRMEQGARGPKAGEKAKAHKVTTDYCAAYLIGRWFTDFIAHGGDMNVKRIDRYTKV